MGHTPGPWTVNDADNVSSWSVQASGRKRICAARWYPYTQEAKAEALDNARLIAAAPELLEACKAVLNSTNILDADKIYSIVKAAVARAEGKQP
jgi:hypothetical protein